MQWRKASERLPEKRGVQNTVPVKYKGWFVSGFRNYHDENPEMYVYPNQELPLLTNDCEWLDEIETPTPESQWPTEEAIRQAAWSHGESVQGDSYEKYTADCAFKEGIQWLKTQSTDREKELRECLGECIELCDSLVKSIGYECVETTEIKSLVTRAKSLLNQ